MIKAIETLYNGVLFRSRLEARYAKLLDSYNIKWAYEVEGYEYNNIRYLPDFYLPDTNILLEVKGPSIPGIEKPTNLRKLIESGINADLDWWNPEVLILVGDAMGEVTIAGSSERAPLSKCRKCKKYFFLGESHSFQCRLCGEYDGDHHLEAWISPLKLPPMKIKSSANSNVRCPKCDGEMVLRTARKGATKGQQFWGCSKYPKCRGTREHSS